MILVVCSSQDPHVDAVIHYLNSISAEVFRWHPDEHGQAVEFHRERFDFRLTSPGGYRAIEGKDVRSCWYRKPGHLSFAERGLHRIDQEMSEMEWDATIHAICDSLDAMWVSHPDAIERASRKYLQLEVARKVGFSVPEFVIGNNPEQLTQFLAEFPEVALKRLAERHFDSTYETANLGFYVRPLTGEEKNSLFASPPISPLFLQRFVQKSYDVRLTVIGEQCFGCGFFSPDNSLIEDWRKDILEHEYREVEVPPAIQAQVQKYLAHFGLRFGAFDFAVDEAGNWWFLECNPNGQWLWIEYKLGTPLVKTMAELLLTPGHPT